MYPKALLRVPKTAALMHNIALAGDGGGVVVVVVAMRRIEAAVAALTVTATVMLEQISCCTCWHVSVQRRMANTGVDRSERSNRKGPVWMGRDASEAALKGALRWLCETASAELSEATPKEQHMELDTRIPRTDAEMSIEMEELITCREMNLRKSS